MSLVIFVDVVVVTIVVAVVQDVTLSSCVVVTIIVVVVMDVDVVVVIDVEAVEVGSKAIAGQQPAFQLLDLAVVRGNFSGFHRPPGGGSGLGVLEVGARRVRLPAGEPVLDLQRRRQQPRPV